LPDLDDSDQENTLEICDDSDYLVDIACSDDSKFDRTEPGDMWKQHEILENLARTGALSQTRFNKVCQASGMNFNPHGIWADRELREVLPPDCFSTRDPMHVLWANGTMNTELYAIIDFMGIHFPDLEQFAAADWRFPACRCTRVDHLFNAVHATATKKNKSFKGGASEILAVYPIVRRYLEVIPIDDGSQLQIQSFLALCMISDLAVAAKCGIRKELLQRMEAKIRVYIATHTLAYLKEFVKPKFHYLWHITEQPLADDVWLDCFPCERHMAILKDCSEPTRKTSALERSALKQLLNYQFHAWDEFASNALVPPHVKSDSLSKAFGALCVASKKMRCQLVPIGVGDIMFCGVDDAIQVKACLQIGSSLRLLVVHLELISKSSATTSH
jgi:hypothetical protein